MMTAGRLAGLLLAAVVVTGALWAESGAGGGLRNATATQDAGVDLSQGLTPREAVSLALKRNRRLMALRKGRLAAEGGVYEATRLRDPELRTGRFDFSDDSAGLWSQNYSLALRWSPPRIGERRFKGNQATAKVDEMDGEIAAAEQELAEEVRLLHVTIALMDQQIQLADRSAQLREQIVQFVESQVEAGTKSLLDQSIAELALADARAAPEAYRLDRDLSMSRLAGELDLPRLARFQIRPDRNPVDFHPQIFDAPRLVETALARRPELAIAAAQCSQAGATLHLRDGERYPWLSFVQLSREFGAFRSDTWGFRVGIEVPVFKWSHRFVQGPAAEVDRCALETEAERNRIRLEVEDLVERLHARQRELEYHLHKIAPLADRDVEIAERAVAAGEADMLQRLTAEARNLARRQAYLTKLAEYRRLEIELDRAVGQAIPE
ncbi:MAG: TolC family protein [Bryobacteraceae bacterium]|nr:TolC family protein [Bryobacteraceae bacterium]